MLTLGRAARADDLDDFVGARDAFINGEYPRASRELQDLVNRIDAVQSSTVRTAARKYLAASLFAERREADARAVIANLLRDEPRTRLEPGQFEVSFARLFESVLRSIEPELDALLFQRAQQRRNDENARDARRALTLDLLGHESRVELVPRSLAFLPFGVGQFNNQQNGLGAVFLSLESAFLIGSVVAFGIDRSAQSLTRPQGTWDIGTEDDRANLAGAMRVLNWGMLGAFVVTAAVGIWRANADYVPQRIVSRVPRLIPPALQGLQISGLPGGAGASLRFTF
ncbi:MAG: hypothetical protein JWM10_2191 [Myxococcaceae bacterium]|nr:hypothetical protein [Myxococcaceae bacterium]